ncbi:MAG TPA: UDP-N-acetylmuramate dehydrogenase [Terriglobales bacterium]
MQIQEHVELAERTTLGVGGRARYFVELKAEADVPAAVAWAEAHDLPVFVLGGGSNLLVSDHGFAGLVLHMAIGGIYDSCDSCESCESRELGEGVLEAGAGELWDDVVAAGVARGWAGIECLSGIPGLAGATPVQNVGAYGQEVASAITRVRAWDRAQSEWVELEAGACGFQYRSSRFNQMDRERFVITRVGFKLRPGGAAEIGYPELRRRFPDGAPALGAVREAVLDIRRGKAMLAGQVRSAGSFFKNPVLSAGEWANLAARVEGPIPQFAAGRAGIKVPAAWLIEQAGFSKGYRALAGGVGLSPQHALAIVNRDHARATAVVGLARRIQLAVDARFGIRLEPEPVQLGFHPGEEV